MAEHRDVPSTHLSRFWAQRNGLPDEIRTATGEVVRAMTDDGTVYDVTNLSKDDQGVTWLHLTEHTVTGGPLTRPS